MKEQKQRHKPRFKKERRPGAVLFYPFVGVLRAALVRRSFFIGGYKIASAPGPFTLPIRGPAADALSDGNMNDDVKIIRLLVEHERLRKYLPELDVESKFIGRRLVEIEEQLPQGVVFPDESCRDAQDRVMPRHLRLPDLTVAIAMAAFNHPEQSTTTE